jgi:hypothetical protein
MLLASLGAESGPAMQQFYGDESDQIISDYRTRAAGKPVTAHGGKSQPAEQDAEGWKNVGGVMIRKKPK